VENLISDFDTGKGRRVNPEYKAISERAYRLNPKIQQAHNPHEKATLLEEKRKLHRQMLA
jgi:hypothetical protein